MAIWKLDSRNSRIQFKVRHLMVSNIIGEFTQYDGTVETEKDDFSDARIHFEASVNSVSTGNEQRDGHLRSPDFFDAAAFPVIQFNSTEVRKIDQDKYKLSGDLTIRGTTRPVTLDALFGGIDSMNGPGGLHTAAGFEIQGKINRKDFGLTLNMATEAGGVVIGEEVRIEITAELMQSHN